MYVITLSHIIQWLFVLLHLACIIKWLQVISHFACMWVNKRLQRMTKNVCLGRGSGRGRVYTRKGNVHRLRNQALPNPVIFHTHGITNLASNNTDPNNTTLIVNASAKITL